MIFIVRIYLFVSTTIMTKLALTNVGLAFSITNCQMLNALVILFGATEQSPLYG